MVGPGRRRPVAGRSLIVPAGLLAVAIVAGGGGTPAPAPEALVELAAVAALVVAVGRDPVAFARRDPLWSWLLVGIVAFPLLQLIPLPPGWWPALPGRADAAAAMTAVGVPGEWRSWSMLPDETEAAALALLPGLAMATLTASLLPAARGRLLIVLVGVATLSALLGLVQFAAGPSRQLTLFADAPLGFAAGVFANRNAHADCLTIALVAALLLADRHRALWSGGAARVGVAILLTLLVAAAVLTGSRMGIATLLVPLGLAAALAPRSTRRWAAGGALLVGMALVGGGTALDRVSARAHDGDDRVEIWRDTVIAARAVAPFGAGMGGFVPLYARVERLDEVRPTFVNRAHDDWLELAMEGGAPALALLLATLVVVARRSWQGWSHPDPDHRMLARFAGLAALVLAAHSIVDYPLRTVALLSVAGLALGGITRAPSLAEGMAHDRLA